MKKALLVLVFLAVCVNAYSAELLIQAKPHWLDSLTEKAVAEMDESTRQSYEARSKIGDVIAVRPDGWAWGKEEGLPNYVVIKVPMTVEEAQKYEEQLLETVQYETVVDGKSEIATTKVLKRKRKYAIPDVYVSTAKTAETTDVSIASKDVAAFQTSITEKVGLTTEVKPPVKDTIKTDLQSLYKKHIQKYVSIARTFWVENAWAATQLKKTICPSGCDYTSLEACMNDNEQDLVAADKYFDVEISGTWSSADTTAVTIHNYTTDATRYINIYTTGDARHSGVYGGYRIEPASGNNVISLSNETITIDGLCLKVTPGAATKCAIGYASSHAGTITIKNNILVGNQNNSYSSLRGIVLTGGTNYAGTIYIFNNLLYNFTKQENGTGIAIDVGSYSNSSAKHYIYNNTVYGGQTGISLLLLTNGTRELKNNLSYGNEEDYASINATTSNNISSDTTSPDESYREKTITFTDAGGGDYSLASTDTDAIDAGVDLGTDYDEDIIETARPQGAAWDIGAFEYITSGAPPQIF